MASNQGHYLLEESKVEIIQYKYCRDSVGCFDIVKVGYGTR